MWTITTPSAQKERKKGFRWTHHHFLSSDRLKFRKKGRIKEKKSLPRCIALVMPQAAATSLCFLFLLLLVPPLITPPSCTDHCTGFPWFNPAWHPILSAPHQPQDSYRDELWRRRRALGNIVPAVIPTVLTKMFTEDKKKKRRSKPLNLPAT